MPHIRAYTRGTRAGVPLGAAEGVVEQGTERPIILVAVDQEVAREQVVDALKRRYAADYEIAGVDRAGAAPFADERAATGAELVVLLSDAEEVSDDDVFAHVRRRFHDVRRGLLIDWGDWADPLAARRILGLIEAVRIDAYLVRPIRPRDETFYRRVEELLQEWDRVAGPGAGGASLIGRRTDPRTHELSAQLARYGIRHDSVEEPDQDAPPQVRLAGDRVLIDPSNAELAAALAFSTTLPDAEVDLAVVGCGPGGLAASVYASSEGLTTVALERAELGGQAGSSSLIRNYLGFERGISGAELAQRSYQQAWAFGTRFALTREVVGLRLDADGFVLEVAPDEVLRARSVVLATGVSYRRLELGELDRYVGTCVFYGASAVEARAQTGRVVHVVGGGNSAGQAALHLARYAASVTLIVRGEELAESMSAYLIDQLEAAGVGLLTRSRVVGGAVSAQSADRLDHIVLRDLRSGVDADVHCDALFITIGAVPHTGWLPDAVLRDKWGFVFTGNDVIVEGGRRGWRLERAPAPLESSVPGLFVVGDARRGSIKRVASAVGEGSVVVSSVHAHLAERA